MQHRRAERVCGGRRKQGWGSRRSVQQLTSRTPHAGQARGRWRLDNILDTAASGATRPSLSRSRWHRARSHPAACITVEAGMRQC